MKLAWDWLIPISIWLAAYLTYGWSPFLSGGLTASAALATFIVFIGLETQA